MVTERRRAQQRQYARSVKGRQKHREYVKRQSHKRRAAWIAAQGGRCILCGRTAPEVSAWEIDHKDPATKRFNCSGNGFWHRRITEREAELAKCQLMCAKLADGSLSCHRKKTYVDGSHGFYNTSKDDLEMLENIDVLSQERLDELDALEDTKPDPQLPF